MQYLSSGFETILNGKNQHPYTGKEVLKKINNKIYVYIDEYGSYRFVFKNGTINISALQIIYDENNMKQPLIANVITIEKHRGKGLATELLKEATLFFNKPIQHSSNLNDNSKAWIKKLNKIGI